MHLPWRLCGPGDELREKSLDAFFISLQAEAMALDQLEVAMCGFDAQDRALVWNQQFLTFFPEHRGRIFQGEHYSENLRRFYLSRLSSQEKPYLEKYVAEGVERHRTQYRPFEFDHVGVRVRVASVEVGNLGRVRYWRRTSALALAPRPIDGTGPSTQTVSSEAAEALECIADGALILDPEGLGLWANSQFHQLYGIPPDQSVRGRRFVDIYAAAWSSAVPEEDPQNATTVLNENQRLSGAEYEIPLPGNRWVRVIERRGNSADGRGYCSHVDITTFKRQQQELTHAQQELHRLATTDALTGLVNRRGFDAALQSEWRRASRSCNSVSLLMIDVDEFKSFNDLHGHTVGDQVLRQIARCISTGARRAGDMVARYGGEEFVMLLPDTSEQAAFACAESIRSAVESGGDEGGELRVTVSIGIGSIEPDGLQESPCMLVERADAALYQAKREGRNRVVVF